MEQLQQMYVLLRVECDGWCDLFCAEGGIAAADDVLEVCRRYLRGRDVEGEDFEGEILEGQVLPLGGPVGGECGNLLWDEEAAVGG